MTPVPFTLGRYAALLYLLNGTAGPDEVALGYPQHMTLCLPLYLAKSP